MKRMIAAWILIVLIATAAWSQPVNTNNVQATQQQSSTAIGGGNADSFSTAIVGDNTATAQGGSGIGYSSSIAEGGEGIGWSNSTSEGGTGVAWSDGDSAAVVDIDSTTISKYHNHVQPLTTYPPYLPLWNHGGWGTINAYFPNGPAFGDGVYQRSFDPSNLDDMRELRQVLTSIPYDGPINALGGVLRGVAAAFGGPDYYHRGRGFEIANSLVRDRRPRGKPLVVFIDSYIDPQLLKDNGYAYVGRISLEGKWDRNWDQVYNAALAETLPWDVDVLLIAGGMKGVTVGSTTSVSGAAGYGQPNYSLSLIGGGSTGVTEGKGAAVVSASGFRYSPPLLERRQIPKALFEKLRRPVPAATGVSQAQGLPLGTAPAAAPQPRPAVSEAAARRGPGIEMSKELYNMAGFSGPVDQVTVK